MKNTILIIGMLLLTGCSYNSYCQTSEISKTQPHGICDTPMCVFTDSTLCIEIRQGIFALEPDGEDGYFTVEGKRCSELVKNNCILPTK